MAEIFKEGDQLHRFVSSYDLQACDRGFQSLVDGHNHPSARNSKRPGKAIEVDRKSRDESLELVQVFQSVETERFD